MNNMITKYKKLKTQGIIDCWKAYCIRQQNEGWELHNAYKYFDRYLKKDNKIITYDDFTTITKTLFYRVTQYLILGEPFHLGNQNGYLKARRVEGRYGQETALSKLGRTEKKEYYPVDDWIEISWYHVNTSNDIAIGVSDEKKALLYKYKYIIARDNNGTGLQERFRKANEYNPTLKLGYDFIPSTDLI